MNWFGDASFWGLFDWSYLYGLNSQGNTNIYKDAVLTTVDGVRLTSVFQYPNTYAAFIMAYILYSLFQMTSSKKWYSVFINSLFLIPAVLSLLLTLSRGALVVFPVLLLMTLPFLSVVRQLFSLIYLFIAVGITIAILQPVTSLGISLQNLFVPAEALKGWLIILGSSLAYALIALIIQRYIIPIVSSKLSIFQQRRFSNIIIPTIGIVVGLLGFMVLFGTGATKMLPEEIRARLENINFQQHSVLERGAFYADSINVIKDFPVLGAGGGGWAAVYEKYQSNPYISREAHNYFIQNIIEVGSVGFVFLVLFLATIFVFYIQSFRKQSVEERDNYFPYFIIAVAILVHSIIDFNMSYVYIGSIVFLCLGGMTAGTKLTPFAFQVRLASGWQKNVYPILLSLLAVFFFFESYRLLNANKQYQEAQKVLEQSKNYNETIIPLDKAINKYPNPEYVHFKLQLLQTVYNQTNNVKFLEEFETLVAILKKNESYNSITSQNELNLALLKQDHEKAATIIKEAQAKFPWDINVYESLMKIYLQLGNTTDETKRNEEWNKALELYEGEFTARLKKLEELPKGQQQGRIFEVTPTIALTIGQVYYYQGKYENAELTLKQGLNEQFPDEQSKAIARFYLASLKKQNKYDEQLASKLMSNDSTEKYKLESLLNSSLN
ncbi:O-antigen ligase family protein [Paenibacillus turpanensis]|uniref:O-antigen ligase family protein n=1 Tax=Paenibacillus turpanensis TaxID=2689078 RepID=UPI00140C604B|nr:O-antigen ligase family protein [Paenibacillus turpanensis]